MRTRFILLGSLLSCIVMAGCELNQPPECLTGMTQCEVKRLMGSAIYSVCDEDGNWQPLKSCYDCKGNECIGGLEANIECETDGETKCYDTGTISIQFTCKKHQWNPSICSSYGCEENHCKDDVKQCQDDTPSSCASIDSLNVVVVSSCENNKMQARYCPQGSVCNDEGNDCNLDNPIISCKEISGEECSEDELISTWSKGICINGTCEVAGCNDGYTMYGGNCKPSTICCGQSCENCMESNMICSSSDIMTGKCIPDCSDGQVECDGACIDPKTSNKYCNADKDCKKFTTCDSDRVCSDGVCVCSPTDECDNACFDLSISLNHCGDCQTDCTQTEGWADGSCISGLCNASECEPGYTLKTKTINLSEVPYCANISTIDACGIAETKCTEITGWKSGTCTDGNCVPTECIEGYHPYDSICEHHDDNNCGSHGLACTGSSVTNAMTTECNTQTGECIATHCEAGYHVYEGRCEKDDNTNCGEHGNICQTDNITGSTQVSCDTGNCLATECNTNYLLDNGTCKDKNCDDGTIKCFTENNIGKRYKCSNNNWVPQDKCPNNYSCKEDNTCGDCTDGEKTCDDKSTHGEVSICRYGQWETADICTTSCNLTKDNCGECNNGATQCNNNGKIGYISNCNNGTWSTQAPCTDSHTCKSDTACGDCQNDAKQCSGKKIQICTNGSWTDSTTCQNPTNGTATCKNGSCNYTCNSDYTYNGKKCCANVENGTIKVNNSSTCSFDCDSGFCKDTTNGRCLDSQTDMNNCGTCGIQCNISKVPYSSAVNCINGSCKATACDNNHVLSNGECIDKNCTENEIKCENDSDLVGKIYKCINNNWVVQSSTTCTGSCKSDNKSCGTCINNNTSCSNDSSDVGQKKTCKNGVWGSESPCNNKSSCNGSTCGNCHNGNKQCKSNTQTRVCNGGKWVNDATCTPPDHATATCSDGICGFDCSDDLVSNGVMCCKNIDHGKLIENSKKCEFTCDTNYFICSEQCMSIKNDDKNNCGSCGNKCDDNVSNALETTCAAGVCKATKCQDGYKLKNGECIKRDCKVGDKRCSNIGTTGYIYVCTEDDIWAQTNQCENNNSCNADATDCGKCINNVTLCTQDSKEIGYVQTCENGEWSDKKSCETNSCNPDNTNCGECKNGNTQCINVSNIGQKQQCTDGKWKTISTCNKVSCNKGGECGNCLNGNQQCVNNSSNIGQIQVCKIGAWITDKTCTNASCLKTVECGKCINGSSTCLNETQIQYCESGTYNEPITCTTTNGNAECSMEQNVCKIKNCGYYYYEYNNHCIRKYKNCGTKGYCSDNNCTTDCIKNYISCNNKSVYCATDKECNDTQFGTTVHCFRVLQQL